jgi:serpin B
MVLGEISREGHRRFADSLTDALYTNENECTSSWGISMVFDLVRPGSTGTTLSQLCDVMSLCSAEQNLLLWNDTATDTTTFYDGQCLDGIDEECFLQRPLVRIANSVWIDNSSILNSSYNETVGEYLLKTDFGSNQAGATVNKWVNRSTFGLIDSIIDNGPISFILLAINSIYLKASWLKPFNELGTSEDLFYTNATRDTALSNKAHFMHQVEFFPYSHELIPGYQIIELPYAAGSLSMLIALPIVDELSSVTSEELSQVLPAMATMKPQRVALALPKFSFGSEYEDELTLSLQAIGLTAPFTEGFCNLFDGGCPVVDFVIQKTVIDVDEKGTVAAAVSAIGFRSPEPPDDVPVLFMADHPFQFFIYNREEVLFMFEGRVGAPTIPQDSNAPLVAVHLDNDFWSANFRIEELITAEFTKNATKQPTMSPTAEPTQQSTIELTKQQNTSPTSASHKILSLRWFVVLVGSAITYEIGMW